MGNFKPLNRLYRSLCFGLSLVFLLTQRPSAQTPVLPCKVVATYPHDKEAFCQGLIFHDGRLYESTGMYGKSSLREVETESGNILRQIALPKNLFGEGLTLLRDTLYQLTWKSGKGFVRNLEDFRIIRSFPIPCEGWGLTHDNTHLIISDGTSKLRFMNPGTFEVERELTVRDAGKKIRFLNELEYIDNTIYANVWQSNLIAAISPTSGQVRKWLDCSPLLTRAKSQGGKPEVLNGIAYDAKSDRLFVTGKFWPLLFEIEKP